MGIPCMANDEKQNSNIKNYNIAVISTCIIKAIVDFISIFIISIPFGEDMPSLVWAIYLIPSVGIFAALAMWVLHKRIKYIRVKPGLYLAVVSAIVVYSIIFPWTYNLPDKDLSIMLNWGLSFLSVIAATTFGQFVYFRQGQDKK